MTRRHVPWRPEPAREWKRTAGRGRAWGRRVGWCGSWRWMGNSRNRNSSRLWLAERSVRDRLRCFGERGRPRVAGTASVAVQKISNGPMKGSWQAVESRSHVLREAAGIRGRVRYFRGRCATGQPSAAGRRDRARRMLVDRETGSGEHAPARSGTRSDCRANDGAKRRRPGSAPERIFDPARKPRARHLPALRERRRKGAR